MNDSIGDDAETETNPAVTNGLTPKPTRRDILPIPVIDQPIPSHRMGQRSWDDTEPSSPRFSRCRFSTIHSGEETSRFSSDERDSPSGLSSAGQSLSHSSRHKISETGKASTPKATKRRLPLVSPETLGINKKEEQPNSTMAEPAKKPRLKAEPDKVKDSDDDITINDVTPYDGTFLEKYDNAGLGDEKLDGTPYTIEERVRNVVRYLRKRKNYHPVTLDPLGCIRINKPSVRCQCCCVQELSEKVQKDFVDFDLPDEAGNLAGPGFNLARSQKKAKWRTRMTKVMEVLMKILEDPASDSAAIIMCTEATPFKAPANQAGQVRLVFPTSHIGRNVQLCVHGIYELVGFRQKEKVVQLFNNHLSSKLVSYIRTTEGRPPRHLGTSVYPEREHKAVVVQLLGVEKKRNQVAFGLWVSLCINEGRHVNTNPRPGGRGITAAAMHQQAIQSYKVFNHSDCINKPDPNSDSSEHFRLSVWSTMSRRLHELTSKGVLVIANMAVLDGDVTKKLIHGTGPDQKWVGSKLFDLEGKELNLIDEDGTDVVLTHSADAGAIEVAGQQKERVLTMVRKAILLTAGLDGSKEGSKLVSVGGDENTHYCSTKVPKPGAECLRDLLVHLCVDPMLVYEGDSAQQMQEDCLAFQQQLVDGCLMLVPDNERTALLATGFTPLCGFGVLASWMNKKTYSGRLTCQVYHTDHKCDFYQLLANHGVHAFVLSIPVTEEGCFIKVYDKGIGEVDGEFQPDDGKLVFIPYGSALAQPITSIHAGGIRTGFLGNPRMHAVVFLVPNTQMGTVTGGNFFPEDYTTSWLVQEPDGRKLEGSKSVRHSGKDKKFGRKGQETRSGLKGQMMKELNELLIVLGC